MTWLRLVRAELRKIGTTRMPWGFLAFVAVMAALNAALILFVTEPDGSKAFIATAEDQRTLLAFGFNALIGAGLFGAIATAREYGHNTIVPTMLTSPRRYRAMLAQFSAIMLVGALLSLVGAGLLLAAAAIAIPVVDGSFLLSTATVVQLLVATTFAGAVGAVLGGGFGALVRNAGGTVAVVVFVLFVAPPLVVQLTTAAGNWVPQTLVEVLSGGTGGPSVAAAIGALVAWALVPAALGLAAVQQRDVV